MCVLKISNWNLNCIRINDHWLIAGGRIIYYLLYNRNVSLQLVGCYSAGLCFARYVLWVCEFGVKYTYDVCNCEMCVKLTRFGQLNLVDSWTIFMFLDENEKIVKILFKCFSFNLLNEVSKYLRVCIFSWEIETEVTSKQCLNVGI